MSEIRERLEAAAEGLTYTSESDRPFEAFELPGGAAGWPYGAEEFARRIGAPAGAPVQERSLARFFAPHIENTDPYDTQTQALRPRYEALRALLESGLREVRVFRVGRVEIDCYAVGADEAGNLAGLRTVAVET
ncbi:MAG: nuclease A inhibitor family protein [Longimicrobiaceae bacterium]